MIYSFFRSGSRFFRTGGIIFWWTSLWEGVRLPCWIGIYRPGCGQTLRWKAWRNELQKRKIKRRPRCWIPGLRTKRHSRKVTLFSFDGFCPHGLKKVFWKANQQWTLRFFYKIYIGKNKKNLNFYPPKGTRKLGFWVSRRAGDWISAWLRENFTTQAVRNSGAGNQQGHQNRRSLSYGSCFVDLVPNPDKPGKWAKMS